MFFISDMVTCDEVAAMVAGRILVLHNVADAMLQKGYVCGEKKAMTRACISVPRNDVISQSCGHDMLFGIRIYEPHN